MKGIIITIFSFVFISTISLGQEVGTIQKVNAKPATFKAEDGKKNDKKRKKVKAKIKAENQKKKDKRKATFKAEDGEKKEKKKVKTEI